MDEGVQGRREVRQPALALLRWPSHLLTGLLVGLVKAYRLLLKPWLGNACRFEPTCSAYALQALQRHGATGGVLLGGWRLMRCHPWCEGGCDPVPDHHPLQHPLAGLFTRFVVAPCPAPQAPPGAGHSPTTSSHADAQATPAAIAPDTVAAAPRPVRPPAADSSA